MTTTNGLPIGMNVRLRRILAGWRQSDLANQIGITATQLSRIERGELEPSELDRKIIDRLLPHLPVAYAVDD